MPELVLVCESGPGVEWERDLLTVVLNGLSPDMVIDVRGSGGEKGAGAVAEAITEHERILAACVRDRDYRSDEEVARERARPKRFMWQRHETENYLLEPAVVVLAMSHLKASYADHPGGRPDWVAALPDAPDTVAEGLMRVASGMAPAQAVAITLWGIRRELNPLLNDVRMNMDCCGQSSSADECARSVRAECERIGRTALALSQCAALLPDSADARYGQVLADLDSNEFVRECRHLIVFDGKRLLSGLHTWLRDEYGVQFTPDTLRDELVRALPVAYRDTPGLFIPDDFVELANRLRALAGLPPATRHTP